MQTVCGTQVSSGRAILETSQDEGGGGGEVSWNHTVVMDNGWGGTSRRQQSAKGELWKIRRGGWVTGILQTYSGESSKFYFDTTKILYPPAKQ